MYLIVFIVAVMIAKELATGSAIVHDPVRKTKMVSRALDNVLKFCGSPQILDLGDKGG